MNISERLNQMKNNCEFVCSGITYGFNQKTNKFYMQAGKEYLEFKEKSELYYDMLLRLKYSYTY